MALTDFDMSDIASPLKLLAGLVDQAPHSSFMAPGSSNMDPLGLKFAPSEGGEPGLARLACHFLDSWPLNEFMVHTASYQVYGMLRSIVCVLSPEGKQQAISQAALASLRSNSIEFEKA